MSESINKSIDIDSNAAAPQEAGAGRDMGAAPGTELPAEHAGNESVAGVGENPLSLKTLLVLIRQQEHASRLAAEERRALLETLAATQQELGRLKSGQEIKIPRVSPAAQLRKAVPRLESRGEIRQ